MKTTTTTNKKGLISVINAKTEKRNLTKFLSVNKVTKNDVLDKIAFYSIVSIYGALFLYGAFVVLSNLDKVSFNF